MLMGFIEFFIILQLYASTYLNNGVSSSLEGGLVIHSPNVLANLLVRFALGLLLIDTVKNVFSQPQAVHPHGPATIVGEMDHNLIDLLATNTNIQCATDVDLKLRISAQHSQGGHGDQGAFLNG